MKILVLIILLMATLALFQSKINLNDFNSEVLL